MGYTHTHTHTHTHKDQLVLMILEIRLSDLAKDIFFIICFS